MNTPTNDTSPTDPAAAPIWAASPTEVNLPAWLTAGTFADLDTRRPDTRTWPIATPGPHWREVEL